MDSTPSHVINISKKNCNCEKLEDIIHMHIYRSESKTWWPPQGQKNLEKNDRRKLTSLVNARTMASNCPMSHSYKNEQKWTPNNSQLLFMQELTEHNRMHNNSHLVHARTDRNKHAITFIHAKTDRREHPITRISSHLSIFMSVTSKVTRHGHPVTHVFFCALCKGRQKWPPHNSCLLFKKSRRNIKFTIQQPITRREILMAWNSLPLPPLHPPPPPSPQKPLFSESYHRQFGSLLLR